MRYLGQYEVTDQDQTLQQLEPEAIRRFTEDCLQLGFVLAGPIEPPRVIDVDGTPWIEVAAPIRSAAHLLDGKGSSR